MSTTIQSISIEQLDSINASLANQLRKLGSKLRNAKNEFISYWVDVTFDNDKMYILADNGYDISSEIEVPIHNVKAINDLLRKTG